MRTTVSMCAIFIAVLFLPISVSAQKTEKTDWLRRMRSPSNRAYHKGENRVRYYALWDGNGASSSIRPLFQDEEFHKELGMTDEQMEKLQQIVDHPSKYVKRVLARLEKERKNNKSDDWKPALIPGNLAIRFRKNIYSTVKNRDFPRPINDHIGIHDERFWHQSVDVLLRDYASV